MPIRKNKKRIDPRYFLNETTYRDLDEVQSPEAARDYVDLAAKIAPAVKAAPGQTLHQSDLSSLGLSPAQISNFMGALAMDKTIGQLEQGRPDGSRLELGEDNHLVWVEGDAPSTVGM